MPRARVAWSVLLALLATIEVVAALETWRLATIPLPGVSGGPTDAHAEMEWFTDGRAFLVVTNFTTGVELSRRLERDWTWRGQLDVWGPILAATTFAVATIWFARRRGWRPVSRLLFPSRPTIAWCLAEIAVLALECGVIAAWMRARRIDPTTADWPAILLCVAGWNGLALLPIGIVLSYRPTPKASAHDRVDP